MLSNFRQLSTWVARCTKVSKATLIDTTCPASSQQRTLSGLSSQLSCQTSNVNQASDAPKLSSSAKLSSSPLFKNASNSVNVLSVRNYMREYYKPSAWKRYNKHNLEKRLTTDSGLEILWRRVLKGRHNLAPYQRIIPDTHDSKILYKHQLRFRKHPLTKRRLPKPGLY